MVWLFCLCHGNDVCAGCLILLPFIKFHEK
jgi:hypothetical protein